jgi:cytochrome oxidase Cu insertion factor (SCO1/SenC/PrrC family)
MIGKQRFAIGLSVILVLCAVLFTAKVSYGALKAGVPAPDFTLQTTTGEEVSLSDFRGRIVILHFWKSN